MSLETTEDETLTMDGPVTIITVSSNHSVELLVFPGILRSALVSSTVRLSIVMACSAMVHAIGAFGIASNMVNIAVFSFQGFSDTVNISLVTLAVSDLFTIVTAQWLFICLNPWFQADLNLAFYAPETQTITGGYPHVFFSRVSAWITAFISVERAVAVTQPFRVRQIFTSRRTAVFNIAVFPVVWIGALPLYATARLGLKFFPAPVNSTLYGLLFSPYHSSVMKATSPVTEIFVPLTNFSVIIVCTAIIRFKVTSMARWSSGVTGPQRQAVEELRDDRGKHSKNNVRKQTESLGLEKIVESKENMQCPAPSGSLKDDSSPAMDSSNIRDKTSGKNCSKGATVHALPTTLQNKRISSETSVVSMDLQSGPEKSGSRANERINPLSSKERRLVVMVSGVSAIFIVCYTPLVVQLAARIIEPELSSTGRYRSLNASTGTIGVMLGCINASINSLVYWRMSSNYRATFRKLLASCSGSK